MNYKDDYKTSVYLKPETQEFIDGEKKALGMRSRSATIEMIVDAYRKQKNDHPR